MHLVGYTHGAGRDKAASLNTENFRTSALYMQLGMEANPGTFNLPFWTCLFRAEKKWRPKFDLRAFSVVQY